MTTTTPPTVRHIFTWPGRDKYGRSTTTVKVGGQTVAMVVKLPRSWTDQHPEEQYLVNDWTMPVWTDGQQTEGKVRYFPTRRAAMAHATRIAREAGGVHPALTYPHPTA